MQKWRRLITVCVFSSWFMCAMASTTFTAHVTDLTGATSGLTGMKVRMELRSIPSGGTAATSVVGCPGTLTQVSGVGVPRKLLYDYTPTSAGLVSSTIFKNTELICGGGTSTTFYRAYLIDGANVTHYGDFVIAGAFVLETASPMAGAPSTPPLSQYLLLNPGGGANQTIAGQVSLPAIGTATNSLGFGSYPFALSGSYWNGSVATVDQWQMSNFIPNTGNNAFLIFNHMAGGSGQTAGASFVEFVNQTAATVSQSVNPPLISLVGTYWTGAASAAEVWSFVPTVANGTNGASTLSLTHAGTAGLLNVDFSVANLFKIRRTMVSGPAPTCAVTGAGTGATCTIAVGSTDGGGIMIINTGTTPSSSGTITLTYNASYGTNGTACTANLENDIVNWNARASLIATATVSTTSWGWNWDNNAVSLTGSTANALFVPYGCSGR